MSEMQPHRLLGGLDMAKYQIKTTLGNYLPCIEKNHSNSIIITATIMKNH